MAGFLGMLVYSMAAAHSHQHPAVFFNLLYNVTYFHLRQLRCKARDFDWSLYGDALSVQLDTLYLMKSLCRKIALATMRAAYDRDVFNHQ